MSNFFSRAAVAEIAHARLRSVCLVRVRVRTRVGIRVSIRVRTRVRIRVRIRVRTRVRTIGLGFEFRVTYLKNSVIIPAASKSFRGLWNQASWKSVACCE